MDVKMDKCGTCAHYQPRIHYCERYLRGKETAVYLCPHCRSKDEEMQGVDFWRERAKKYEDIIANLVAEQAKGVKLDSIEITGGSIIFKKSRPKSKTYSKADYVMALHKEYGCTLTRAEEAHDKALEYLRSKATMRG